MTRVCKVVFKKKVNVDFFNYLLPIFQQNFLPLSTPVRLLKNVSRHFDYEDTSN
jgi:hypothetical protein